MDGITIIKNELLLNMMMHCSIAFIKQFFFSRELMVKLLNVLVAIVWFLVRIRS